MLLGWDENFSSVVGGRIFGRTLRQFSSISISTGGIYSRGIPAKTAPYLFPLFFPVRLL